MKKKSRYAQTQNGSGWSRKTTVLSCVVAGLAFLLVFMILLTPRIVGDSENDIPKTALDALANVNSAASSGNVEKNIERETEPTETEPEETEPVMLEHMAELYAQNPDIAGWLTIEGTVIDYPVMHTPDDYDKYLYADFNGKFDVNGMLIAKDGASLDPKTESDNITISGHNMLSGSMFGTLAKYKDEAYWKEHPVIKFSTLYEEREYEVIAVFYDRIYKKTDVCFKYYQFIDAETEEEYQEAIDYYMENALYDTGLTAEFGDRLLTLNTCAYHVKNGRFVVVAREITEPEEQTEV